MHRMPITKFWLWDGLGLCVSAPVVIGIGWWLADNMDEALRILTALSLGHGRRTALAVAIAFVLWRSCVVPSQSTNTKARLLSGCGPGGRELSRLSCTSFTT